ncbi:hypothetical protein [uncultured Tenacibaculum sp.]|uniref:hypothetical protein n=1 Tax=uncultured Tenacibaculum sp. TaxID=174713 RepID=UPI002634AD9B|nr:hypothetical protein [uncultured Tenacibaculum sp.]
MYTINQKKKTMHLLSEEPLIKSFANVEIKNIESINRSFWIGNVKLFKNYILIQSKFNYDVIQLNPNFKNDIKFKILYQSSSIESKTIKIIGTKNRLFEKSSIQLKIKFDSESDSKMVYSFLNQG